MLALPTKDETVRRYHLYRCDSTAGFSLPLFPSEANASNDRMRAFGYTEEWRETSTSLDLTESSK